MSENQRKAVGGIRAVMSYFSSPEQGYECEDVSKGIEKLLKGYKGFDVLAKKNEVELRIKVKGSFDENKVPDCYPAEFEGGKLVADLLCLVKIEKVTFRPLSITILTKEEVDTHAKLVEVRRIKVEGLESLLNKGRIGKVVQLRDR